MEEVLKIVAASCESSLSKKKKIIIGFAYITPEQFNGLSKDAKSASVICYYKEIYKKFPLRFYYIFSQLSTISEKTNADFFFALQLP